MRILREKLKLMIRRCSSSSDNVVVVVSLPLRLNINVNFLYPSKELVKEWGGSDGAGKFCILNETWAVWSLCNQTPPKSRGVCSRGWRRGERGGATTKIPRSAQHSSSRMRSSRRGLVGKHSDRHTERKRERERKKENLPHPLAARHVVPVLVLLLLLLPQGVATTVGCNRNRKVVAVAAANAFVATHQTVDYANFKRFWRTRQSAPHVAQAAPALSLSPSLSSPTPSPHWHFV